MKSILTISGWLVILTGAITFIGWVTGIQELVNMNPAYIPMSPASSVFFVAFGYILIKGEEYVSHRITKGIIIAITTLFSLYGFLQFAGYFFKVDLTFEYTLFPVTEKLGNFPLKHMSPYEGLLFFMSGIAMLFIIRTGWRSVSSNISAGLGLLVAFAGFVAGLGYMFGTPFLYSGDIIPLALRTALSFLFLGFGLLFVAGEDTFFLKHFIGYSASARILRVSVPIVVSIFMLQGILDVIFTHYYKINEALLLALLTLFSVVISIVIIVNVTNGIFQSANIAEAERLIVLEELKKGNTLQSLILENSTMGIYMVRDRIFQWTNSRLGEIFQIPVKDLQGVSTSILFPSDDKTERHDKLYDTLGSGKNVDTSLQLKRGNGELFWCRFVGTALDPDRPNDGSVWMVEDITERRKLREKTRLLSHTIESLAECISITDTSDRIIFVNQAFRNTYGYTEEELLGKNISVISSLGNDSFMVRNILPATVNGGWQGEVMNRRKNGTEFPVYLATSRVLNENGEVVALVGVATDITERRKDEAQLKKYADDLKVSNDAKDKLFSIISHDLRSPFNSILGFFNLLTEEYDKYSEKERKSFILNIKNSSENLFQQLEDLLIWSRTQTGGIKVTPIKISLAEITEQQVEILKNSADSKNISLVNQTPREMEVWADKEMIKTVLLNLTVNAIKFTNPGGYVTINATDEDGMVNIFVADDGVGLASSELKNIFRLDKSHSTLGTSNEKGTGLGLQICREFVEKNGGRIWVESEKGKGSKFTFTLPKYNMETEDKA